MDNFLAPVGSIWNGMGVNVAETVASHLQAALTATGLLVCGSIDFVPSTMPGLMFNCIPVKESELTVRVWVPSEQPPESIRAALQLEKKGGKYDTLLYCDGIPQRIRDSEQSGWYYIAKECQTQSGEKVRGK